VLIGVLLAAAATIQGIVAELLTAGAERRPSSVILVAALVGLTILIAVITAWQGWVGVKSHDVV